jgi:hypothetical protein
LSQIAIKQKIVDFLNYYEQHNRYYQLAFEKAEELTAEANTLKALSIRWMEAQSPCGQNNYSQLMKCMTNCERAFICSDGTPFNETGEFSEIARLKGCLKDLATCYKALHPWLLDVKNMEENTFSLPKDDTTFNKAWILQFVILNVESTALHDLIFTGEVLQKAVSLLESIDFTRKTIRCDLLGPKNIPKLLIVVSAMVKAGADYARLCVDLIEGNNYRWKYFKEIIDQDS